jgi:hypothetical protein
MDPRFGRWLRPIAAITVAFFSFYCIEPWNYLAWAQGNQPSAVSAQPSASKKPKTAPQKFEETLQATQQLIENLDQDVSSGKDITLQLETLKGHQQTLEGADSSIRAEFTATETFLKGKKLPAEILDRHAKAVADYDSNYKTLKGNLDSIVRLETERKEAEGKRDRAKAGAKVKELKERIKAAKDHLTAKVKKPRHQPLDPNNLPHRTPKVKERKPRLKKEEFTEFNKPIQLAYNGDPDDLLLVSNTSTDLPTDSDLAETIEVQFTQEINDLAASLDHNPVKIYNWVRNNIDFTPTWGSIQGANHCLLTKQCNAFDTASLLIALMRTSGIPARYVMGTIELPIDQVMNWVGGFTNANAALQFIASGGIPVTGLQQAGTIKAARMEHVWVEAYVDYIPSRGAIHKQGDTWVPMDPSFKQFTFTPGIDLQAAVPFDAVALVTQLQSTATIDEQQGSVTNVDSAFIQTSLTTLLTQRQNYLDTNLPNATGEDLIGKKAIITKESPFLAGTLPYKTVVTGSKVSGLTDSVRHKITLEVTMEAFFGADLTFTASLPELAMKRISLNYGAATATDEAVVQANAASTTMPAYLINLKPRVQIDGTVVAEGSPVKMGQDQTVTLTFSRPNLGVERVTNNIVAGSYNALVLDLQSIPAQMVEQRKLDLQAIQAQVALGDFTEISRDDIFANILTLIGQTYFGELDTISELIARQNQLAITRLPSESFVSFLFDIDYLFDVPLTAKDGGMGIDVDLNVQVVLDKGTDLDKIVQFRRSSGGLSSALEHTIWEQLFSQEGLEGISAVKLLKLANDQGVPIFQINATNIASIMSMLELSQDVKEDIINAVNAGMEVTVPKKNITLSGWAGVGYVIFDSTTGDGAYLINGGLSGGAFTLLGAFFSSIADWISINQQKGYFPKSNIVNLASKISAFLTGLGFIITVISIVSNPNLSPLQQILQIIVWASATIAMISAGAFLAANLVPFAGVVAIIGLYVLLTAAALWVTGKIEGQASYRRKPWVYA